MTRLDTADTFPSLQVDAVGGGRLRLPEDLAGSYGVVLFNRGSWCPFCMKQLESFQRAQPELVALGVRTVALSADDRDTAEAMVRERGLAFPVGHGAVPAELAAATGAFVSTEPAYVQSTGFVLDPAGRVVVAVYSSGAIGRLVPADVLGLVRHHQQTAAA